MTKDVLVTISGLQFSPESDASNDIVEVISAGDYYNRNGKHYIVYDEVTEGYEGATKNIIKLTDEYLDITKKGVSNVHMIFEKNKKNVTYYSTPFGSLLIGINAKSVDINETDKNIDVNVNYNLEVNYEHMANCSIKLNIKSKEAKDFTLS